MACSSAYAVAHGTRHKVTVQLVDLSHVLDIDSIRGQHQRGQKEDAHRDAMNVQF